jgi:ferredoxin
LISLVGRRTVVVDAIRHDASGGGEVVAAIPLPGSHVTHPLLMVLAMIVLVATLTFWYTTRGRARRAGGGESWEDESPWSEGGTATVNVDPVRCARFGFCEHEAPEVFQIRREGRLTYRSRVSGEQQIDSVIRALEVCPARAITMGKIRP